MGLSIWRRNYQPSLLNQLAKKGNTLATKKETEDMIPSKVTESSVTLKADDWRAPVKTVYVPTQLILQWTGAKTKEDIDLSQRFELTIGLKDKS